MSTEWERIVEAGRARVAEALATMAADPPETRCFPESWLRRIASGGGDNGALAQRLLDEKSQ